MASRSPRAARLVRVIALVLKAADASPLLSYSITGVDNKEADFVSRHVQQDGKPYSKQKLLTDFNNMFPNSQGFTLATVSPRVISKMISEMLIKPSKIDFWLHLPRKGTNTGNIGLTTVPSQPCNQYSNISTSKCWITLKDLPAGSALTIIAEENRLKLHPFHLCFLPFEYLLW